MKLKENWKHIMHNIAISGTHVGWLLAQGGDCTPQGAGWKETHMKMASEREWGSYTVGKTSVYI